MTTKSSTSSGKHTRKRTAQLASKAMQKPSRQTPPLKSGQKPSKQSTDAVKKASPNTPNAAHTAPRHVSSTQEFNVIKELGLLLKTLPAHIRSAIKQEDLENLIEIVLDLGRIPEARFRGSRYLELGSKHVTHADIDHVVEHIGQFNTDNRAGLPRTLHRISAIRNRQGEIVGLTCRVGKAITGTITHIMDLITSGKSILLLGPPGVGKTTKLREISKLLADELQKRVVIVDSSNEIAGDGDIPHPAVGRSRRMQVREPEMQKAVMIEAVENHTPEVIVVDEIGTEAEAMAARTIAERGVLLVATAHGSGLESIVKNPMLSDLIGGIQTVTLGDDEAKRRQTQKTILERENKPTFDICIEIHDYNTLAVYPNVAEAVDNLLRGWTLFPEVRRLNRQTGESKILQTDVKALPDLLNETAQANEIANSVTQANTLQRIHNDQADFRLFIYSINRTLVERIIERLHLTQLSITNHIHDANAIIALRGSARPGSRITQLAKDYEVPIFITKTNTMPQIQRAMREAMNEDYGSLAAKLSDPLSAEAQPENETDTALNEAREAITQMLANGTDTAIELTPRRSYLRRLQHELIEQNQLVSISVGDEPRRRLKILPPAAKTS